MELFYYIIKAVYLIGEEAYILHGLTLNWQLTVSRFDICISFLLF